MVVTTTVRQNPSTSNSSRRGLDRWTIDHRSAALARIILGILLVIHAIDHLRLYSDLYSPSGSLPPELLPRSQEIPYFPSLLTWLDQFTWGFPVFLLATVVSYLAFIVGWKTRLATLASLCVFSSICHRNPYLVIGSDELIGSMLLWFCLIPLGARFSIDCAGAKDQQDPLWSRTVTMPKLASLGVLAQLCTVYFVTAWRKTGPSWWEDGTALHRILGLSTFRLPGAVILESLPDWALQGMSRGVLVVEYAIPFLILSPLWQPLSRRLAIMIIWCLHLGIAVTIDTGLFSLTMLTLSTILLTPADWKLIEFVAGGFRSNREFDAVARVASDSRNRDRWLPELGAAFLLLGFVQQNYQQSFPILGRDELIPGVSVPWRFAAAAQRWTMFAPDPPLNDPQIMVKFEMADGSTFVAWDNHSDPQSTLKSPAHRSFLWKLFMLRVAMMHDEERRLEGAALRDAVCDFFVKDCRTEQPLAEQTTSRIRKSPSVDRAELWVTLVSTDRRQRDIIESACVARHELTPTERE